VTSSHCWTPAKNDKMGLWNMTARSNVQEIWDDYIYNYNFKMFRIHYVQDGIKMLLSLNMVLLFFQKGIIVI